MSEGYVFTAQDLYGHSVCVSPINQVTPNLFIGDHNAASNIEILKNYGITNIVNCAIEIPNYFAAYPDSFGYINLNLEDADDNISIPLKHAYSYITKVLKLNPNSKILVHCHMGKSRSASVVIYYLMKSQGLSYNRALAKLKESRPIVQPNAHYSKTLSETSV